VLGVRFAFDSRERFPVLNSRDGSEGAAIGNGCQPEPMSQIPELSPPSGGVAGVDVRSLPPGTELVVDTHNSRYHFFMPDGGDSRALVQGGPYFQQETQVRISGSALGTHLLKIGWIGVGLCVELSVAGRRVVTSRVQGISIEPNPLLTLSKMLVS
jgi:hypothetical protein